MWTVAAVVATEVPPQAKPDFGDDQIALAIRCVLDVMKNRAALGTWGDTLVEVVLAPKQFSAVCREDYWIKAMAGKWCPSHVQRCFQEVVLDRPAQIDATYYYSPVSMKPPGAVPGWAASKTEVLVPGLSTTYFRFYK